MPYLRLEVDQTLTEEQKDALAQGFGKCITLIPGKQPEHTMINISDGHTMYFPDRSQKHAYLEVKAFGEAADVSNQKFAEAAIDLIHKELGVDKARIYLTIAEHRSWGLRGTMKFIG